MQYVFQIKEQEKKGTLAKWYYCWELTPSTDSMMNLNIDGVMFYNKHKVRIEINDLTRLTQNGVMVGSKGKHDEFNAKDETDTPAIMSCFGQCDRRGENIAKTKLADML